MIANRTISRAQELAQEIGCVAVGFDEIENLEYHVLINGTSVGMKSDKSPWPADAHRAETIVFDTVYTPLETQLLLDAQAAGAVPVCGVSMFVRCCRAVSALDWLAATTAVDAPCGVRGVGV